MGKRSAFDSSDCAAPEPSVRFFSPYLGFSRARIGDIDCSADAGRTKQSFKDECDINVLMRRYEVSGVLPQDVSTSTYGDFSDAPSFMEAQNVLARANAQFASLPARVRDRFGNDPAVFLEFIAEDANYDEALKLGLLKSEAKPRAVVSPPAKSEVEPTK
ncbi:MAG: internal scaffolding protein [Microviridae sp.]|nr:MAG: internal scaffolding protein [Microviridae sp.]